MRRPAKQARGPEQNTLLASSGRCEGRGQLRKGHTWGPTPQEDNLARWTTWKGRGAPAGRQTRRRGWGSELTPRSVRASPPRISTRPSAGTRNSLCQGISKPGLYASTEHMGRGGSEVLRINLDCAPKSLHRGVFVLTPKAARESIPRSTLLHWQPPRLLSPPNGTKTGPLLHCTKDPHCGGLTRRS